jgi:hypothetical protein
MTKYEAQIIHKGVAESFRLTVRVVCCCIGGILNDRVALFEGTGSEQRAVSEVCLCNCGI